MTARSSGYASPSNKISRTQRTPRSHVAGGSWASTQSVSAQGFREETGSTEFLMDPSPSLLSCMCDTIVSTIRQECKGAIQGCIREDMSTLTRQQDYLVERQAEFMKAILQHIENLTEAVKTLEEKAGDGDREPGHALDALYAKAVPGIKPFEDEAARPFKAVPIDYKEEKIPDQSKRSLMVTVIECTGLFLSGEARTCDPFCECRIRDQVSSPLTQMRTPALKNTVAPKWEYKASIAAYKPGDSLIFQVKGKEAGKEDFFFGQAHLDSSFIEKGCFDGHLTLEGGGSGRRPCLHVAVKVKAVDAPKTSPGFSLNSMVGSAADEEGYELAIRDAGIMKTSSNDLDSVDVVHRARETRNSVGTADLMAVGTADLMAEETEQLKRAFLRRIPYPPLRAAAMHCFDFLDSLKEPERVGKIAEFERSKAFFILSLVFVIADQALTVSVTNHVAQTLDPDELPGVYSVFETLFLAWFAVELVIKLGVHRGFFFIGENQKMNCLDFFLVVYSFIEALGVDLSFLRALRIFKMAKVVRTLKALKSVRDLRVMIDCLISSWFAMFWAIVLIGFLSYMFALVFVQAMSEYMISEQRRNALDPELRASIMERFGSVQAGILSLFMSLTGGFDWGEIYDLIVQSGPVGQFAILFFVTFFTISVWNIVGSIFVEKVMDTAKPTPHELLLSARKQDKTDASEMTLLFTNADENQSGTVDHEEWCMLLDNGLSDFMASRDANLRDKAGAEQFYKLAMQEYILGHGRVAEDGSLPPEMLVSTFIKTKGTATGLDLALMKYEVMQGIKRLESVINSSWESNGKPSGFAV